MKKRILFHSLIFLLCSFLFISNTPAQQVQPTPSNSLIQNGLVNLKEKLDFLRTISKQYPDPRLNKLNEQIELHLRNAQQANQLKQHRKASNELSIANKLVNEALKLVMSGPVNRLIEQVNEQIRIVEQSLQRNFNAQAQKILEDAKQSRNRASISNVQNVQKIVEWLRVALTQAQTAFKLISQGSSNLDFKSAIHEEKSNFNDLLNRAKDVLQQNPGNIAQQHLNQAINLQLKAEAAISRGNYQQAVEAYRNATRLLFRVVDLSSASEANWQRKAKEELQVTRELLRSIEQTANLNQFPRLQKLYQQATKVYLDAEHSFSKQNYQETVNKAEVSRRLLNRANQLITSTGGRKTSNLLDDFKNIQNILSQLEKEFDPNERPAAKKIFDAAQRQLNLCRQANRGNRLFLARAHLFVATRFTNGLRTLLQRDTVTGNISQRANREFESFQERFRQISSQYENSENQRTNTWLQLARNILNVANTAISTGEHRLLLENVRIGNQILNQIK